MPRPSEDRQRPNTLGESNGSPAASSSPRKRVFFVKFVPPDGETTQVGGSDQDAPAYSEADALPAENNDTPWFWVSVDTPQQASQLAAAATGETGNTPERRDVPMPPPRPVAAEPPPEPQPEAPPPPPSFQPPSSTESPPSPTSPARSRPQVQQSPQSTEDAKPASTRRVKFDRLTGKPKDEEPSVPNPVRVRRNLEWPE